MGVFGHSDEKGDRSKNERRHSALHSMPSAQARGAVSSVGTNGAAIGSRSVDRLRKRWDGRLEVDMAELVRR
jgi:hypothetical protein